SGCSVSTSAAPVSVRRRAERADRADAGTRTPDPFITSEVLYQLSYVGGLRGTVAGCRPRNTSALVSFHLPWLPSITASSPSPAWLGRAPSPPTSSAPRWSRAATATSTASARTS